MSADAETVGAFDAKTRLSQLLDEVGRGASFTITRRDRPVARLVAHEAFSAARRSEATQAILALRARYRLRGLSVRALRAEGRA